MYSAVQTAFVDFTRPLEGCVRYMYADTLGLVTTAIGNLIDSVEMAETLQWRVRATGAVATPDQVAAEWHAVKDGKIAAWHGPRPLYITDDAIDALVLQRLLANERFLSHRWSNWSAWSADAQLGGHSCAWAAGPAWRAPHFDAAVAKLDFQTCAGPSAWGGPGEAWLNDTTPPNPGLRPRNLRNQILFRNAARVIQLGLPLDELHWPNTV